MWLQAEIQLPVVAQGPKVSIYPGVTMASSRLPATTQGRAPETFGVSQSSRVVHGRATRNDFVGVHV